MIFDNLDLDTATNEEILEMELSHVAYQLLAMGMNKRLCSLEGREVIAEYGFSGNFDDVVHALNMYSEMLEDLGVCDDAREGIIKRKEALIAYRATADSDDKYEAGKLTTIMEAIKTRDPEHVIATTLAQNAGTNPNSADVQIRQNALHDAKMCVCYTN